MHHVTPKDRYSRGCIELCFVCLLCARVLKRQRRYTFGSRAELWQVARNQHTASTALAPRNNSAVTAGRSYALFVCHGRGLSTDKNAQAARNWVDEWGVLGLTPREW